MLVSTVFAQSDLYWDADSDTTSATGGTGVWTIPNTWRAGSSTGTLQSWADGNNAFFGGTAGMVQLGNSTAAMRAASMNVSTTGYTLYFTSSSKIPTVTGNLALGASVGLRLQSQSTAADSQFNLGTISNQDGSGELTLDSSTSSFGAFRVNLTADNSVVDVSTTITTSGASGATGGSIGYVSTAHNVQVTGNVINNSRASTMMGANSGDDLNISGEITGSAGVRIQAGSPGNGAGTVTLSGNNTFTGSTEVSAASKGQVILKATLGQALGSTTSVAVNSGTLIMGMSNQINNAATVTLNGGTFNLNGKSEGTAGTDGVGALTLASTSVIDFGSATVTNLIQFAGASHTSGTLQITDWQATVGTFDSGDQLLFAGTSSMFSSTFSQSDVSFNGTMGYGLHDFTGYYEVYALAPVPEPSTWAAGALALGALVLTQRRRFGAVISVKIG